MKLGILYGVGVGPGDPDLITVKGAKILSQCRHIFAPKANDAVDSVALAIAKQHVNPDAVIHEVLFPMTKDRAELRRRWEAAAEQVAAVLCTGEDVCFLTLGDALLYSTYIYLVRALRTRFPGAEIVTVPGITSFSAAAALSEFPIGEAKNPVTIIPTSDDLEDMRRTLNGKGAVVLMKIGKRLPQVLDAIENAGASDRAVFVSHAGMENVRIETDLRKLRSEESEAGYLSIILVRASEEDAT